MNNLVDNDGSVIEYKPLAWNSESTSVVVTFAIIAIMFVIYYFKLKDTKPFKIPRGYVFCFQVYIEFIHNLVLQILGPKFEKITPFFIYLFSYIFVSNTISIFGFVNPTESLTITLSLAFVTWVGIFVVGFKYQKLSYLKKYTVNLKIKGKEIPVMINPLNIISGITPLISLSFRLWGNIFAGTIIITMSLTALDAAVSKVILLQTFNVVGGLCIIPLNIYFDLISGLIQTFVFVLLTMIYWKLESKTE